MKKCITCGLNKPDDAFVFDKRYKKYQNRCLECDKKYHRAYYEKRKAESEKRIIDIDPNVIKRCIKCGKEKPLTDFRFDKISDKTINTCNECKALITRDNYLKNREKRLAYAGKYRKEHADEINKYFEVYRAAHAEERTAYSRQYGEIHKEEIKIKSKIYRQTHKDEIRERDKEYARAHKEQIAQKHKEWYAKHSEERAEYNKFYREANADAIKQKRQLYDKKHRKTITAKFIARRNNDPLFKLSTQVRGLIRASLKKKGYGKDSHTYEIIGCNYEMLFEHLKQTWLENYGTEWDGEDYHIDHIIPLATAKTKQEVLDLCYYENLQMLTPHDNLRKNKKLDWSLGNQNTNDGNNPN
ncbi:hypothetical protein J6X13_00510 [Candidatus Saccharibacteria bacterium]|nr:hypothetical protein [Candidatus Saccharibacteria bacterium]